MAIQRLILVAAQAAQAHGTLHLAGTLPAPPQGPTGSDGMPCPRAIPTYPSILSQELEQCYERLR